MDRKASKTEREEWITVIYCHFRFSCVWVRALPQAPGKPQHSTAALKETRPCCHHGGVGSKALTYGESYLDRLVRRTEAGRWPRWFPGCFWQREAVFGKKTTTKKTTERLVLVRQSGSSCSDGQKRSTKVFYIQSLCADCRCDARGQAWAVKDAASDTKTVWNIRIGT